MWVLIWIVLSTHGGTFGVMPSSTSSQTFNTYAACQNAAIHLREINEKSHVSINIVAECYQK